MNLKQTKEWATKAHRDQKYDTLDYDFHLQQVEDILIQHGFHDENVLKTAWLHDVLENTSCSQEDFLNLFGRTIFTAVTLLAMKGITRKMRDYSHIAENKIACLVKLADRIVNIEFSIMTCNFDKMNMYLKERDKFKTEMFFEDDNGMWDRYEKNFDENYNYYYNRTKDE